MTDVYHLPISLKRKTLRHMYDQSGGVEKLLQASTQMLDEYDAHSKTLMSTLRRGAKMINLEKVEAYETIRAFNALLREIWIRPIRNPADLRPWGEMIKLTAELLKKSVGELVLEINNQKAEFDDFANTVPREVLNHLATENVLIYHIFQKLALLIPKWRAHEMEKAARPSILRSALMSEGGGRRRRSSSFRRRF